MSILEGWETPKITISHFDDLSHEHQMRWGEMMTDYPWMIELNHQKDFYDVSFRGFKPDITDWLNGKGLAARHPFGYAVLLFAELSDVLEFKLKWG